jgi:hypothetical protein
MGYINQPFDLRIFAQDIYARLNKLETAQRFTAPDVSNQPAYPRIGDIIFNNTDEMLQYWNGTDWVEVADNNLATSINTANATLAASGTAMTYTGNPCIVEAQRIGKMITAYAEIVGTTITSWGTGQIYFTLPGSFPIFAHDVIASGSILDGGTLYTIFGKITQGDNKMYLFHPTSNGGSDEVTHNKPAVLDSTSQISINGVAIIA